MIATPEVEQYYVSGLEAGRRNATLVTLWKAVIALGVEASYLVARGGNKAELPKSTRRS